MFLPTQLGKHVWLAESSVLGIRIDYLAPTLFVTDLLLLLTLVFFLREKKHDVVPFLKNLFSSRLLRMSFLLLFLAVFSGLFFSERPVLVLYGILKGAEMIVFFLITAFFLRESSARLPIAYAFSCGMVFESSLAVGQFLRQSSLGGVFYFFGERTFSITTPSIAKAVIDNTLLLRPYGTLAHPNVLSGYLLFGLLFLSPLYNHIKSKYGRYWFVFVLFCTTLAILLSLSRVVIVLFFFLLMLFLLGQMLQKKLYKDMKQGAVVIVSIILLLSPLLVARFAESSFTSESYEKRLELNQTALQIGSISPLFGVGLNHFLVFLPRFSTFDSPVFFLQPVHNVVLLLFSETGIVGVVSALLFAVWLLRRVRKDQSIDREVKMLTLFSLLLIGMVDHYFLTVQQGQLLLAFLLGWVVAPSSFALKNRKKFPK